MKKRIFSGIIAMAMMATLFTAAPASAYEIGDVNVCSSWGSNGTAEITTEEAYHGTKSLKLKSNGGNMTAAFELSPYIGKKIRLEYYRKGAYAEIITGTSWWSDTGVWQTSNKNTANYWVKESVDITTNGSQTVVVCFRNTNGNTTYIDNVSVREIYNDGSLGAEANGKAKCNEEGWQDVPYVKVVDSWGTAGITTISTQNAYAGNNAWRIKGNGGHRVAAGIEFDSTVEGTIQISMMHKGAAMETITGASFYADTGVHSTIPAHSDWTEYTYEVTPSGASKVLAYWVYGSNEAFIDNLTIRQKYADGTYGPNVFLNSGFGDNMVEVLDEVPVGVSLYPGFAGKEVIAVSTDVLDGNYSLDLNVNTRQITMVEFKNDVPVGTYKVSFWYKGALMDLWMMKAGGANDKYNGTVPTVNGWTKFETEMTTTGATSGLCFDTYSGHRVIDNVSVTKKNSDGTYGENLVKNPGFENLVVPEPEEVIEIIDMLPAGASSSDWGGGSRIEGITESAYEGNYALAMSGVKGEWAKPCILLNLDSVADGSKIRVKFMHKGGAVNVFPVNGRADGGANFVEAHKDWTEVSMDITSTQTQQTAVLFQSEISDGAFILVDNMTVQKINDNGTVGENLLKNGTMEKLPFVVYDSLYNVVAYAVKEGGAITVSWTNPHAQVSDVKVYVDNSEKNVTVNTAMDAYNSIYIGDLSTGEHTVKVTANIDGEAKIYEETVEVRSAEDSTGEISLEPGIGDYNSKVWKTFIRDNGENYANTNIFVETADNNSYAVINGNMPTAPGNVYAGIEQAVTIPERCSEYTLTFKAKADNAYDFNVIEDIRFEDGTTAWVPHKVELTEDWAEYSVALTGGYSDMYEDSYTDRILIMSERFLGSICIDDVSLVANGVELIGNGDFEPITAVYGDAVLEGGSLKTGSNNVSVTVENGDSLALVVALYKGGKLVETTLMSKTATTGAKEVYESNVVVPDEEGEFTAKVFYFNNLADIAPIRAAVAFAE